MLFYDSPILNPVLGTLGDATLYFTTTLVGYAPCSGTSVAGDCSQDGYALVNLTLPNEEGELLDTTFSWKDNYWALCNQPTDALCTALNGGGISFMQNILPLSLDGTGGITLIPPPSVPEPSTWALMLVGFGGLGLSALLTAGKGRRATTAA